MRQRSFWDGLLFGFTASLTLWQDLPPVQVVAVMVIMIGAAMVTLSVSNSPIATPFGRS